MKYLLLLLSVLCLASCLKDEMTSPNMNNEEEEMEVQEEEFDLAELEIFGTWELLDLGPLGCRGDYYTFNEDRTLDLDEIIDCDQIPFPSFFSRWWEGTEDSFTILQIDPLSQSGEILSPEEGKVYTIIFKDETNIQTSTPAGELLEINQWKKVE